MHRRSDTYNDNTIQELRACLEQRYALQEEWGCTPREIIQRLISSMPSGWRV